MIDENLKKIIESMAENEKKVEELYIIYSGKYPEQKKFWQEIANEEASHSLWLKNILSLQDVMLEEDMSIETVQYFNNIVQKRIDEAKEKDLTFIEALARAYDLETALLESDCFNMFKVDSVNAEKVMQKLDKSTKEHKKMIYSRLEEERKKNN